jgi:glycosyltransferase involved in cell wall biosynthesis
LKNILIIPSWFPTKLKPSSGLYFLEHAQFLTNQKTLKVSILFGEKGSSPLIGWIFTFFKLFFFKSNSIRKVNDQNSLNQYVFFIPANRRVPDCLQLYLERLLYKIAFKNFLIHENFPDLIHAQSGMDAAIYVNDLAKSSGLPFLILEHQVFVFHYYTKLRAKLILDAFKEASKVGVVSAAEMKQVLLNQPHCNPVIIPNLIDEHIFQIGKKESSYAFRIITVMYAQEVKGFETFFKSLQILMKANFDFKFTVIGNPWKEGVNLFRQICSQLDLIDQAELIDRASKNEIITFYQNSDLYVCSSDFETFGIAPREALMCGVPLVSTANGGVEDVVVEETGILVPIRDSEALANAILKIRDNYSNYNPHTIREIAIKNCGKDKFLRRMEDFYNLI